MNSTRALTVLAVVLGVILLCGAGYLLMSAATPATSESDVATGTEQVMIPEENRAQGSDSVQDSEPTITWQFAHEESSADEPDSTRVTVVINGVSYDAGSFNGSCSELGASGGIDGKGLLAGELSAAQCWFAGAGNEIGVFAHEDGGYDLLIGTLSEGVEGEGMFRGDFTIKATIQD